MLLQQLPLAKDIEFTNSSLLSLSYDRWEAEAKWGWFVVVPLELVNRHYNGLIVCLFIHFFGKIAETYS